MLNVTIPRQRIVTAARGWLGTPYHHQASLRGVGSDCLGLIRGLWRELQVATLTIGLVTGLASLALVVMKLVQQHRAMRKDQRGSNP